MDTRDFFFKYKTELSTNHLAIDVEEYSTMPGTVFSINTKYLFYA